MQTALVWRTLTKSHQQQLFNCFDSALTHPHTNIIMPSIDGLSTQSLLLASDHVYINKPFACSVLFWCLTIRNLLVTRITHTRATTRTTTNNNFCDSARSTHASYMASNWAIRQCTRLSTTTYNLTHVSNSRLCKLQKLLGFGITM